jgi:hypothetical protein
MLILLAGTIGRSVTGGQAWANLQYLLGLRALGHEVYYLEDVGDWSSTYDWEAGQPTESLDYPANYIQAALAEHGLGDRWIYRAGSQTRGRSLSELRDLCQAADLLVIRGVPMIVWRPEYDAPRCRAFIDVDPGFTQISFAKGDSLLQETIGKSESVFTFGRNIGQPDCPIPTGGRRWLKTVPPVFLPEWPVVDENASDGKAFTSIMRWRGVKDREYNGVNYGQKDREFPQFLDLPKVTAAPFRLALTGGGEKQCRDHGWDVMDGWRASKTPDAYRDFIKNSRAEFGVAKHCYVHGRVGWISDRSICYLASGKPVLIQQTGVDWFSEQSGVLTFTNLAEAAEGVKMIQADYAKHSAAARRLAERHFTSDHVLAELVDASTQAARM